VTSTQVIGNGSGMNYNNIIEMDWKEKSG